MKPRQKPNISSRKRPLQERSTRLVSDILEAAAHVLARDGVHRFTTARVAERAGVSVGSLYQYFPNKAAILFRLQTDEWARTGQLLESDLLDTRVPPLDRLRSAIRTFFQSECEEAELRVALDDAAPFYRGAAEAREHRKSGVKQMLSFTSEALPGVPAKTRVLAADVILTSMSAIGKKISEQGRSRAEVDVFADAVSEMLGAYLDRLKASPATSAGSVSR
jgi:AcrR family transcriptional regulator